MNHFGGARRCYNGHMDKDLRAELESREAAIKSLPPGATCTYFPVEQRHAVFYNYRMVGEFEHTVEAACRNAIDILGAEA